MAYCTVADLLIGDIRTSGQLDPQKYVNDAADEIDSKIGFVYETPIPIDATSPTPRPVVLLLKRLNSHLASGRLILAGTISAEDKQLNAYGEDLVRESMGAIEAIASGTVLLDGVTKGTMTLPESQRMLINNHDQVSLVDLFYDDIVNPNTRHPGLINTGWRY